MAGEAQEFGSSTRDNNIGVVEMVKSSILGEGCDYGCSNKSGHGDHVDSTPCNLVMQNERTMRDVAQMLSDINRRKGSSLGDSRHKGQGSSPGR